MALGKLSAVQNHPNKIQLSRISSVYFEHANLDAFHAFAVDFGFQEVLRKDGAILYGGYGVDQYCYIAQSSVSGTSTFKGPTFVAKSELEFEKASLLKGATVIDLSNWPGGGKAITLKSPSGFSFNVIYGQQDKAQRYLPPSAQVDATGPFNGSLEKRRLGWSMPSKETTCNRH
jgi:hypothetical protein